MLHQGAAVELGFGGWVGFLWAEMWRKKIFPGKGPLTHKARESRDDGVQLESGEKPTQDIDVGAVGDETGKAAKA